jgi:hypothetical protein
MMDGMGLGFGGFGLISSLVFGIVVIGMAVWLPGGLSSQVKGGSLFPPARH